MFANKEIFDISYAHCSNVKNVFASRKLLRQSYSLHWHDYFEIECLMNGSATVDINGRAFSAKPGTVYLLTPIDFHKISVESTPCDVYHIVFGEDVIPYNLVKSFLSMKEKCFFFSETDLKAFSVFADLLIEECHQNNIYHTEYSASILECISILLLRLSAESVLETDSKTESFIHETLLYLHTHFLDDPSLEEVAAYIHLHPNYLSTQFHNEVGISFKKYLNNLKLAYACKLLTSTTLSVTDVCFSSGFNSLSHFQRAFKKRTGVTPLSYRHSK